MVRIQCRVGRRRGSEGNIEKDGAGARKDMFRRTEKGLVRTCSEGRRRGSEGHVGKDGEGARKDM